jgi:hypothetical protein
MIENNQPMGGSLNAPVPGMSLTTEPGSRPWENPPSMVTVEEAIVYYTDKILKNVEKHEDVLDVLERGIPVRNFANMLNTTSVMDGRHTLDVGILVMPVIEELIMTVADMYSVRYITSIEDVMKRNSIHPRQARLAVEEAKKSMATPTEETEPMEPMEEQPKGLMARPMGEE